MKEQVILKPVNDVFEQFLTKEEMANADAEADAEMLVLKGLLEDVSIFAAGVMAEEKIGFRAFARRHDLSLSMASKILKGSGNLTLETIAHIAAQHGKKASLVFEDL